MFLRHEKPLSWYKAVVYAVLRPIQRLSMNEHTTTQCVLFPGIFKQPVVAQFDQSQGSSDGGAVLLKAADRGLGLTAALAACLKDDRQEVKVRHELEELDNSSALELPTASSRPLSKQI